jgi:molecular chaperone GrpE
MRHVQDGDPSGGSDEPSSGGGEAPPAAATGAEGATGAAADAPAAAAADPVRRLQAELAAEREKARESHERLLRAAAEFDNYRKRIARDKERDVDAAREKVLKRLIGVVDNFERGLDHMRSASRIESLKEGTEAIYQQLLGLLAEFGVKPMEALHAPFDPKVHEALAHQPSADHADGTILAVAEKGYLVGDRVLRFARVVVSKAADAATGGPDAGPGAGSDGADTGEGPPTSCDGPGSQGSPTGSGPEGPAGGLRPPSGGGESPD